MSTAVAFAPQKDGSVAFGYTPKDAGQTVISVQQNQQHIGGSPFNFCVDNVDGKFITAYGSGLAGGVTGEPCTFCVSGATAKGSIGVGVSGPADVPAKVTEGKDGVAMVTYVPTAGGVYAVAVTVNKKEIAGSPFQVKVSSEGRKKAQIAVNSTAKVSVNAKEKDVSALEAKIKAPSGKDEPCRLTKREDNDQLGFVFSPKEAGDHLLTVTRDGKLITGSPFKVPFKKEEVGNPGAVKVSGKALESGMARTNNEVTIDTTGAGYGILSLAIDGRQRAQIDVKDLGSNKFNCIYKPSEPGAYLLSIKYADQHVAGSPFQITVAGEPSGKQVESITSKRHVLPNADPGRQAELCLKLPNTDPFDMEALLAAPNGSTECCEIMDLEDHHYTIRFTPKEKGVHVIGLKHKQLHIPGSPFMFTVGPLVETGAHKVRAFGQGLIKGEINHACDFNIYTKEAGPGALSISVEGAAKAKINFEERSIPGSVGCDFVVDQPGDYSVSVKWDDQHIPDSPFLVNVSPDMGEARKVVVSALRQQGVEIGKPNTFKVKTPDFSTGITGYCLLPSGEEKDLFIQEIDKEKSGSEYAVRFVPEENGPHYLHVLFNGHEIPYSPFFMAVGKCQADPGLVTVQGDGLTKGSTGKKSKFFVNTTGAGAAQLDVIVEGPSKAQLSHVEKEDGYEFSYLPTAPGDYYITVKFAGPFHVAGSPFKAVISGTGRATGYKEKSRSLIDCEAKVPGKSSGSKFANLADLKSDASKVVCKGNGLKKAFMNKKSLFTVETRGAGENILFIGILGPEGPADVVELLVKKTSRTTHNVSYTLKSKGNYQLIVRYGEDNAAGGPFPLECA